MNKNLLTEGKVSLAPVEQEYLSVFKEWRNSSDNMPFFREYRLLNNVNQEQWFEKITSDKNQVNFAIKKNLRLIGHCGLYYIDWVNRKAEFGLYIGKKKGKGYGKTALELLLDYGFNVLNLHKVWCEVFENNSAIEMYKNMGFTYEGTLRDNHFWGGEYLDSHILSITEEEYTEIYENSCLDSIESVSSVIK